MIVCPKCETVLIETANSYICIHCHIEFFEGGAEKLWKDSTANEPPDIVTQFEWNKFMKDHKEKGFKA